MTLFNKGLKYNFQHKPKGCIRNLILGVHTVFSCLHAQWQDFVRCQVAINVKNLYMQHNDSKHYINQLALKELQNKLTKTN
jgi:hypothetical protein